MAFRLSAAATRIPKAPFRVAQIPVRYASRKESQADPVKEVLRRTLYPPNIRNRASPTGAWRPDVEQALQMAIPSKQAHETIERAWKLHQRHVRKRRDAELQRKFSCMKQAMDTLARVDPYLFEQANRPYDPRERKPGEDKWLRSLSLPQRRAYESRVPGLFPRELRPPTDTPPRDGWKYEFTTQIPVQPEEPGTPKENPSS